LWPVSADTPAPAPAPIKPPVTARVPGVSPQLTRPAHVAKSMAKAAIRMEFLPLSDNLMQRNKRPNCWGEAGKFAAWLQTIVNKECPARLQIGIPAIGRCSWLWPQVAGIVGRTRTTQAKWHQMVLLVVAHAPVGIAKLPDLLPLQR
jgi:hypothetical protein